MVFEIICSQKKNKKTHENFEIEKRRGFCPKIEKKTLRRPLTILYIFRLYSMCYFYLRNENCHLGNHGQYKMVTRWIKFSTPCIGYSLAFKIKSIQLRFLIGRNDLNDNFHFGSKKRHTVHMYILHRLSEKVKKINYQIKYSFLPLIRGLFLYSSMI